MTKNILNISQNIFDEVGVGMVENFLKNICMFFISLISFLFFGYIGLTNINSLPTIGIIASIVIMTISSFSLRKALFNIFDTIKAYKILYAFNKNIDAFNLNEIINARKHTKEINIKEIYPIEWVDFALSHICVGNKGLFVIFETNISYKVFMRTNILDYDSEELNEFKFFGDYATLAEAKEKLNNYMKKFFDAYKNSINKKEK